MKNVKDPIAELLADRYWQIPRESLEDDDEPLYVRVYCRLPDNERVIALRHREYDAPEAASWELHFTDAEADELIAALVAARQVGWDDLPVETE